MEKAKKMGAVSEQEASVEAYVSHRAVDALYVMIAEEEKAIRKDPIVPAVKSSAKYLVC